MKNNCMYLRLQFKKINQLLPRLIAITIVLTFLVGAIAFYGTKLLYKQTKTDKITVAMVIKDQSALMDFGMSYLESSESINTFCQLVKTTEKEANEMLENKTAAASIYFPKDFALDIVNGVNTPAIITFSKETGIEQLLFQELTTAAARILTHAQAGIYSMGDVYDEYDFRIRRSVIYDYVNENTLGTALVRSKLFQTKNISPTGAVTTPEYYIATALVLLTFLSGMALSHFSLPEKGSLAIVLSRMGLHAFWRTFLKYIALVFFYLVIFGLLLALCCAHSILPWQSFVVLPFLALLAGSWVLFVYHMTANETIGSLFMFLAAFLSCLVAGCLIPSAFLPEIFTTINKVLPTHYLHRLICILYTDVPTWADLLPILLFIILFFVGSCLFARRNQLQEP